MLTVERVSGLDVYVDELCAPEKERDAVKIKMREKTQELTAKKQEVGQLQRAAKEAATRRASIEQELTDALETNKEKEAGPIVYSHHDYAHVTRLLHRSPPAKNACLPRLSLKRLRANTTCANERPWREAAVANAGDELEEMKHDSFEALKSCRVRTGVLKRGLQGSSAVLAERMVSMHQMNVTLLTVLAGSGPNAFFFTSRFFFFLYLRLFSVTPHFVKLKRKRSAGTYFMFCVCERHRRMTLSVVAHVTRGAEGGDAARGET